MRTKKGLSICAAGKRGEYTRPRAGSSGAVKECLSGGRGEDGEGEGHGEDRKRDDCSLGCALDVNVSIENDGRGGRYSEIDEGSPEEVE